MGHIAETLTMHNGITIPRIGFGTFRIDDGANVTEAVLTALEAGYRHIDTAKIYGNERGVGEAIRRSGVPREDLFITSKLWNSDQGYQSTFRAFNETLERLGLDYLDLYLIHWPKSKNRESWKAMCQMYEEQQMRAIGVSNFNIRHLNELISASGIVPMVNQIELHPRFNQQELRDYCSYRHIVVEAWGPLMQGALFDEPLFQELAASYGKTIAQIALRWHYQMNIVSLPKSVNPDRIRSNADIFDFSLSDEDMARINSLPQNRIGPDPDNITF